jgi:hypothetical protein
MKLLFLIALLLALEGCIAIVRIRETRALAHSLKADRLNLILTLPTMFNA